MASLLPGASLRVQIAQTQAMLANEYGTASNIKSRVNRQSVLAAITAAGERANNRQAVIDAYFRAAERTGTVLGDYRIGPRGQVAPARFTAFRVRGGRAEYLR